MTATFARPAPCGHCPARSDVPVYLRADRRVQIIEDVLVNGTDFYCHQTTVEDPDDDSELTVGPDSKVCAGFAKMIDGAGGSTQMMRIAHRLGRFDPDKIDRGAPVWDADEFAAVPENAVKRDGLIVDASTGVEVEVVYPEPCSVVWDSGCEAPAGWMGAGGAVVSGTTTAENECYQCGDRMCDNCTAPSGLCKNCDPDDEMED